ncbi:APC family permease [Thalassolituus sp. C2-1]|uniref:APC family permease n=1 Tax=Venatorbacter sp. C2-1 TaxID=2597518 RepID=UPI00119625EC|nr:APC family permease [Thalassolituus sp. C2-1]TVV42247.1 amino acid permease [Thalassolituus sp. C2-1]
MKLPHWFSVRSQGKALGLPELIAIALGGMVGGGIFTILGISVALIGPYTPLAIMAGGIIAALAAYSYVKLGVYYRDEGATYGFFKRTFPNSPLAAALIGWYVIFGYISTIALYAYTFSSYAYTFSSYALSGTGFAGNDDLRKAVACGVIALFTLVNVWSVRGMGKIEDIMVYSKLALLLLIAVILLLHRESSLTELLVHPEIEFSWLNILTVAAVTFVAYEGFQLVINAVKDMENPDKNIPRAIYSAIAIAIILYVVIAVAAILAIPAADIIANEEYALAAGAGKILGHIGADIVVLGAVLATSSAINGTLFGASRQVAVIAGDCFFPKNLEKRSNNIPVAAIAMMAVLAMALILAGGLKVILEFGSVTFLLVSLLMAIANFRIRKLTDSSLFITLLSIIGLAIGGGLILHFEYTENPEQLIFMLVLYAILTLGALVFARVNAVRGYTADRQAGGKAE